MFCAGIHFAWPSPSLPRLLSEEYPFNITTEEASYITIIGPFGDIFGDILSAWIVDLVGRKITILLISVPQLLSFTCIYLSSFSKILLYVARFSGGVAEGACFTILPIYICEISEPKIRGLLGASFSLIMMFGIFTVNVVGSYTSLCTTALVSLAFVLLFIVTFLPQPESPYYLLMKNKPEEARRSLKKLRHRETVDEELATLTKDVRRQMSERGTFKDLVAIKSNKMASIVMVILRILQQYSGFGSFSFYAQLLFKEATDAIPQHLAAILMITIQATVTTIPTFIVDIVGRKPLIMTSIGGCCVTLFFNGVFFILRDSGVVDVSHLTVLPLVGLLVFIVFFATGLGSVVNLVSGELFPATIKAKALCVMNVVFAVSMLTSTKFYQYTADNYSLAIPFMVFGVFQFVGFILCWRFVPETRNKTLEQIQQELKGNVR
ncbi:hypothetical protein Zmor_017133 [Zophobas morio]|uniref:Major facilitator superfamily (MFS) profile domain-containing protein n=1 Tax=Zophobas morio TaxID=2755281 RepID=A0AA38IBU2_9CUCU|nr:hypothetical protein Zmor_017133 [Zophobas morio]